MRCQDKLVFITGASSGIGRACTELFAQEGAKLLLCARRDSKLKELSKELEKKYSIEILSLKLDVSDARAVESALQTLPPSWQEIDILINNAGFALGLDKIQQAKI